MAKGDFNIEEDSYFNPSSVTNNNSFGQKPYMNQNNNFNNSMDSVKIDEIETRNQERSNIMDSRKVEIVIDGMACGHCSGRVEQALNALEGVSATVDLAQKTAFVTVTGDVSNDKLSATVTDCGYTVVEVK